MIILLYFVWALVVLHLTTDGNEAHFYTGIGLFALGMVLIMLPKNRERL